MVGIKLGKNARQSLRNIFKKLQTQHNSTAGSSSGPTAEAATPEADENEADEESDEKKSPKKTITKRGTATKKPATPKKTVGKNTTPKKAAAKAPAKSKAKGKKAKAESEGEEDAAAKTESSDEKMKDGGEDGKLPQSPSSTSEVPHPVIPEAPLTVVINGEIVVYTPRDIEVAESHEVSLVDYLIWKSTNDYDFYLNADQNTSASQGALEISDKV
jgi:hypothetical protein